MKKEFVNYKQALAIKELGFDEPCLRWYVHEKNLSSDVIFLQYKKDEEFAFAPLKQQVFRWFRQKHKLKFHLCEDAWNHWVLIKLLIGENYETIGEYPSYNEAESSCIDKLIEIVKTKQ